MAGTGRRLLVMALLFGLFLGMVAHYSAAADRHVTTRQSAAKLAAPADHVGESVYFWSRVEAVEGDTIVVSRSPRLAVTGVDADARAGDAVQVYGVIRPDGMVAAERVIVSARGDLTRLYAVSTLALVLAVACFLRSWTVNGAAFVPREGESDA